MSLLLLLLSLAHRLQKERALAAEKERQEDQSVDVLQRSLYPDNSSAYCSIDPSNSGISNRCVRNNARILLHGLHCIRSNIAVHHMNVLENSLQSLLAHCDENSWVSRNIPLPFLWSKWHCFNPEGQRCKSLCIFMSKDVTLRNLIPAGLILHNFLLHDFALMWPEKFTPLFEFAR